MNNETAYFLGKIEEKLVHIHLFSKEDLIKKMSKDALDLLRGNIKTNLTTEETKP